MAVTINMGDLAKMVETGRFANWLGMNFNCYLDQHKGCWFAPEQGGYACSCECHPSGISYLVSYVLQSGSQIGEQPC